MPFEILKKLGLTFLLVYIFYPLSDLLELYSVKISDSSVEIKSNFLSFNLIY